VNNSTKGNEKKTTQGTFGEGLRLQGQGEHTLLTTILGQASVEKKRARLQTGVTGNESWYRRGKKSTVRFWGKEGESLRDIKVLGLRPTIAKGRIKGRGTQLVTKAGRTKTF